MTEKSTPAPSSPVAVQTPQILAALRDARARIESLERDRRAPIAIVGTACRLPGEADSPEAFWDLLASGRDAITPIPADRWTNSDYFSADPQAPGKLNVSGGGFIALPQDFDPEFFGMAPREALSVDPQQRLLLEVTWEALENAGVPADRLNGREIGVFTAICWNDYGQRLLGRPVAEIDAYMASGIANSMAAGRLSYTLGLQGPSVTVDTACSSSLVAVHLACQSLRNGECEAAIVGAASLLLHPELYVNFTKARMLSPDNRCKAFDASANGFVRSEGCVVVVLKRLSDALANGDDVLAVIEGSAINHDGHTSGLTVPNGPAQQDVIRKALRAAGVAPDDIDYIEAHGTGTSLGDPIEVGALGAVFGNRPHGRPLVLGAVKSNIGHLEAAAGLAGLLKVVLALRHEAIPPNLHFHSPNPHIDWPSLPFLLPVRGQAWKRTERKRRAGISSFGFSGTNAHVVVAEAPLPVADAAGAVRPRHVLTISARTESALKTLATRYAQRLRDATVDVADVAFSANTGRAQFQHRLALCASTAAEAAEALSCFVRGEDAPAVVRGRVERGRSPRIAFLFTGQGSQYAGMGRALYEGQPTFKAALDRCQEILADHGIDLRAALCGQASGGPDLNATQVTQPALFALEYGLGQLWLSWGVQPAFLLGHSVGEYVAACLAGVFTLEDGLKMIAARGRLMGELAGDGAMAALFTDEATVAAAIGPYAHEVAIAAVNGPANTVISGARAAVERLMEEFTQSGVRAVPLVVSHAFHSPLVEPMLADFRRVAASVRYSKPRIEVISNLTGGVAGDEIATADYWCRHVRAPVRFAAGMQTLHARGCDTFIEVGPRPVLLGMGRQCLPEGAVWLPSIRPDDDDWNVLLSSLAMLYVRGAPIDWTSFDRGYARKRVRLPNYPFERRRYWIDAPPKIASAGSLAAEGSLLGARVPLATADVVFASRVRSDRPAYLEDHVVAGQTLMPATAFVEMARAAARAAGHADQGTLAIEDVVFSAPLVLDERRPVETQLVITAGEPQAFRIFSLRDREDTWTLHVSGRLGAASVAEAPGRLAVAAARASLPRCIEADEHYERVRAAGFEFGPAFRGLRRVWRSERTALGEVALPESLFDGCEADPAFHPALLDACLQVVATFLPAHDEPLVPLSISRITVYRSAGSRLFSYVSLSGEISPARGITADVVIFDEHGEPVATVEGFACRPLALAPVAAETDTYEIDWRLAPRSALPPSRTQSPGNWLIVADDCGYAEALADALQGLGAQTVLARSGRSSRRIDERRYEADLGDAAELGRVLGTTPNGAPWTGVIHCAAIGPERSGSMSLEQLKASQASGCASLLALAQAMAATPASADARLVVVTRGVHSVATEPVVARGIAGATAWGLARVIASEHPSTRCTRIDLDVNDDPRSQAGELAAEVLGADDGEEVALRAGRQRYTARLRRRTAADRQKEVPAGPVRLESSSAGILDELRWTPHARRAPGRGEVEIEVRATGLGFRDVLNALNMYPGGPVPLGCECSGVVVATGPDVDNVAVGDAVLAVAYGSFATHITVPADWVVRKPSNLSFEQAAAIPSSFLTAEYSLVNIARLAPGQRVLIHAGAGGVGIAAIQVALRAGAEVFATAGSPAKRAYLSSIGVHHTHDSRSTAFADEILKLTDGCGVDVVLNSLAGEFIERSFAVLAEGGCFVELGKRDILDSTQAARLLKPGARYVVVDMGQVCPEQPALVQSMLARIVAALQSGVYWAPPVKSFVRAEAVEAFQHMARARHTGKIVVTNNAERTSPSSVRRDGTYLVTGGLGALGLEVAKSLVARGARHVALMARRAPDADARDEIARLEQTGARVRTFVTDVAQPEAVAAALAEIRNTMPPLRGVVHAAGVLDDGVLLEQRWNRCDRVLAPKVYGGWNLYQATRQDPLDFFVLFSAAAGLLGIPGQSSYAAANVFLDSLAFLGRHEGRFTTSIDWGAWNQVGMTRAPEVMRSLAARGLRFISAEQGMSALWQAIEDDVPQRVVLPIDWGRFRERAGEVAMPLLAECFPQRATRETAPKKAPAASLSARLRQAPPQARDRMLLDLVRQQIRSTIGLAPDQHIDENQPLQELGMDSLMAVELRNGLAQLSGATLPATFAFDYPTAQAMTRYLRSLLDPEHSASAPAGRRAEAPSPAADIDVASLSEEDAARMLLQELDGVAGE